MSPEIFRLSLVAEATQEHDRKGYKVTGIIDARAANPAWDDVDGGERRRLLMQMKSERDDFKDFRPRARYLPLIYIHTRRNL